STIFSMMWSGLPSSRACFSANSRSLAMSSSSTWSSRTTAGRIAAMCSAMSLARVRKPSPFATKSVSQFSSSSTPTLGGSPGVGACRYAWTRPSLAVRSPARSLILAPVRSRTSSAALSKSPSASVRARLQSIIPAPVASRRRLTSAAVKSATKDPPRRFGGASGAGRRALVGQPALGHALGRLLLLRRVGGRGGLALVGHAGGSGLALVGRVGGRCGLTLVGRGGGSGLPLGDPGLRGVAGGLLLLQGDLPLGQRLRLRFGDDGRG